MPLTPTQRRSLRARAHVLHPIVTVGAGGVSAAVVAELEQALEHHELLKVRVSAGTRDERRNLIARLADETRAEVVQTIGHLAVLFREKDEP